MRIIKAGKGIWGNILEFPSLEYFKIESIAIEFFLIALRNGTGLNILEKFYPLVCVLFFLVYNFHNSVLQSERHEPHQDYRSCFLCLASTLGIHIILCCPSLEQTLYSLCSKVSNICLYACSMVFLISFWF